jgi:hypothetical protein
MVRGWRTVIWRIVERPPAVTRTVTTLSRFGASQRKVEPVVELRAVPFETDHSPLSEHV